QTQHTQAHDQRHVQGQRHRRRRQEGDARAELRFAQGDLRRARRAQSDRIRAGPARALLVSAAARRRRPRPPAPQPPRPSELAAAPLNRVGFALASKHRHIIIPTDMIYNVNGMSSGKSAAVYRNWYWTLIVISRPSAGRSKVASLKVAARIL